MKFKAPTKYQFSHLYFDLTDKLRAATRNQLDFTFRQNLRDQIAARLENQLNNQYFNSIIMLQLYKSNEIY